MIRVKGCGIRADLSSDNQPVLLPATGVSILEQDRTIPVLQISVCQALPTQAICTIARRGLSSDKRLVARQPMTDFLLSLWVETQLREILMCAEYKSSDVGKPGVVR